MRGGSLLDVWILSEAMQINVHIVDSRDRLLFAREVDKPERALCYGDRLSVVVNYRGATLPCQHVCCATGMGRGKRKR
eukprot:2547395-Amphidinium_carterae.1